MVNKIFTSIEKLTIGLLFVLSIALFLFPTNATAYPVGLVSYWQFDEGTGSTLSDSLGNSDGTIYGASWDNDGLVNGALNFDGNDDIVRLTNISGYGDFTMSAWFKPSLSIKTEAIFQTGMGQIKLVTKPGEELFHFLINEDRQGGGGNQYDYRYDMYGINLTDTWHFATMTGSADNSQMKAYLDGVLVGDLTYSFSGWNSTTNYTNIGAMQASLWLGNQEGSYFTGLIDEVAQFDRPLPASEISYYYQLGLNGQDLSTVPPIPEPTTILLVGSGILGLAGFRRKFRKP